MYLWIRFWCSYSVGFSFVWGDIIELKKFHWGILGNGIPTVNLPYCHTKLYCFIISPMPARNKQIVMTCGVTVAPKECSGIILAFINPQCSFIFLCVHLSPPTFTPRFLLTSTPRFLCLLWEVLLQHSSSILILKKENHLFENFVIV